MNSSTLNKSLAVFLDIGRLIWDGTGEYKEASNNDILCKVGFYHQLVVLINDWIQCTNTVNLFCRL